MKKMSLSNVVLITIVRIFGVIFCILLFPLLILNKIDYTYKIKHKNPFYQSIIVKLMEKHLFLYDVNAFFWHFPVFTRSFRVMPELSGKVLQVGCGTGLFNKYYNKHGKNRNSTEIVNLDYSIKSLEYGQKKNRYNNYINASIYSVPLEDNIFDTIFFARCFHHIRSPKKAFKECERLLKKNGTIVIYDPVSLSIESEDGIYSNTQFDGVVWRFNKESIVKCIKKYLPKNLTIESVEFKRHISLLNYNIKYPHTEAIIIIKKL